MRNKKRGSACVYHDKARNRWRVQVTRADGTRASHTAYSQDQAEAIAAAVRGQLKSEVQTVGEAIKMYLSELETRGTKQGHRETVEARLRMIFPDGDGLLLKGMHPLTAQALYDAAWKKPKKNGKPYSPNTHRNALGTVKSMYKWLVKSGTLGENPFEGVEGVGKRKRGKTQLTIDESRLFLQTCLDDDSVHATAALCCLVLALRASEVVRLTPRCIDDGGRILRIEKAKTGDRLVEVPEMLRDRMPALAEATLNRQEINYHVHKLCKRAGVESVGPHALRGTHASLATRAGASSQLVADTLGHASDVVTKKHYTQASATRAAAGGIALRVLSGGRS